MDVSTAKGMWAPVIAEFIDEKIFKITNRKPIDLNDLPNWREFVDANAYEPDYEEWEFSPGTFVRCEFFQDSYSVKLFAVERVDF